LPVKIICQQCKAVLYENPELVSPRDIMDKFDSKCPKCSALLNFDPANLTISVSEPEERKGLLKIFQK
jgi:hypothetical protein